MTLPESVLLCLFPNGLVLSPLGGQQQGNYNGGGSAGSDGEESNEDNEVYIVDVSFARELLARSKTPELTLFRRMVSVRSIVLSLRARLLAVRS